jgi:hypothetical protein
MTQQISQADVGIEGPLDALVGTPASWRLEV